LAYAGFWRRFAALFVDGLLVLPVSALVRDRMGASTVQAAHPFSATIRPGDVVLVAVVWLYFAGLESSPIQATLGKRLLGIGVTDACGDRLSFARATGRHFAKALSFLVLGLGYAAAAFTGRKQALHDLIAGALVVRRREIPSQPARGTIRVSSLTVFVVVGFALATLAFGTRNAGKLPRADIYLVALGHLQRAEVERIADAYRLHGLRAVTLPNVLLHDGDRNPARRQLAVERVAGELRLAYGARVPHGSALVGVTGYDIYSADRPGLSFVFSDLDERGTAVVSIAHMEDRSVAVVRARLDKVVARDVDALLGGRLTLGDVESVDQLDRLGDPLAVRSSGLATR
jgi:uncharacterized RDD family membrane protein YckC